MQSIDSATETLRPLPRDCQYIHAHAAQVLALAIVWRLASIPRLARAFKSHKYSAALVPRGIVSAKKSKRQGANLEHSPSLLQEQQSKLQSVGMSVSPFLAIPLALIRVSTS